MQTIEKDRFLSALSQVRVYRLITESTVEERIIQRARIQLRMDALVIQGGRLAEKDKKLDKNDMLEMIQFGAEKMFRSKDSTVTDDDIDAILERGQKKTSENIEKVKSLGDLESLQGFTFDTQPEKNMMEFEGKVFKEETGFKWIAPPKRDRKVHYGADCMCIYGGSALVLGAKLSRPPLHHG